jgi:exodeoxyribonuclease VII large subunit
LSDGTTTIWTVSEFTQEVKTLLEQGFASVWVAGEISNLSRPSSGHVYLTLKDAQAQVPAVLYRGIALRLRFELKDGLAVIVRGRLSVYPPQGKYQLVIEQLEPKGVGAVELALRQLREKLFRLGFFDPKRKRRLPRFPKRLALVTSPTGAAVRDMLEILGRRWPLADVYICPVRVQGETAADEITRAIRWLNKLAHVEVIILGRGGGSVEDLWPFNAEGVAQAIFESRIPVVSAVGHETDVTIADLVADRRALTPSEAAELVVPDRDELRQGLDAAAERLRETLTNRLRQARQRLQAVAERRVFRQPLERVREAERRLDELDERQGRAVRQAVLRARQRTEALAGQLETLSPLRVLGRGYSLTRRAEDNAVVRSAEQVQVGERLVTVVERGRIVSRVEETGPG